MVEENGSVSPSARVENYSKICSDQQVNSESWLKQDSGLIDEFILIQTFNSEDLVLNNWTKFCFPDTGIYSDLNLLEEPYAKSLALSENEGLNLIDSLIFPHLSLNLRCLAADIRMRVRLGQNTKLELILRSGEKLTENCPVIRICKDYSLRGVFVFFGTIDLNSNQMIIKKQFQLPESQVTIEEVREFEILVTDNGDDCIYVNVNNYSKASLSKQFMANCGGFLPIFTPTKLCLTAHGSQSTIKSMSIKYRSRLQKQLKKRGKDCVCSIF